jgi:hypothetical protein
VCTNLQAELEAAAAEGRSSIKVVIEDGSTLEVRVYTWREVSITAAPQHTTTTASPNPCELCFIPSASTHPPTHLPTHPRIPSLQVPMGEEFVTQAATGKYFHIKWAQDESGNLQVRCGRRMLRPRSRSKVALALPPSAGLLLGRKYLPHPMLRRCFVGQRCPALAHPQRNEVEVVQLNAYLQRQMGNKWNVEVLWLGCNHLESAFFPKHVITIRTTCDSHLLWRRCFIPSTFLLMFRKIMVTASAPCCFSCKTKKNRI